MPLRLQVWLRKLKLFRISPGVGRGTTLFKVGGTVSSTCLFDLAPKHTLPFTIGLVKKGWNRLNSYLTDKNYVAELNFQLSQCKRTFILEYKLFGEIIKLLIKYIGILLQVFSLVNLTNIREKLYWLYS